MTTRYIIAILIVSIFIATLHGCRVRSINGELDAQWKVTTIQNLITGEETHPESVYYCLYRHTVNLTRDNNIIIAGNMVYAHDRLKLEFPTISNVNDLSPWGIASTNTDFEVMTLSSRHLTIKSDHAIIELKKW